MVATTFGLVLLGLVAAISLERILGTPTHLKSALNDSGVYERMIDEGLNRSQPAASDAQEGRLPVEREEVRQAAKAAFSPNVLRQATENIIDGTYVWLDGKADKPTFQVDLTAAKEDLAERIGHYIRSRIASLPPCTFGQIPDSRDPYNINCKVPGIDYESEISRIENELTSSNEYVGNPIVTADTLTVARDGKQVKLYEQLAYLPTAYQRMKLAPLILCMMAVLAAIGIIFLSRSRRQGVKLAAWLLIIAGALLMMGSFLLGSVSDNLSRRTAGSTVYTANYLEDSMAASIANTLEKTTGSIIVLFGILYILMGTLLIVGLRLTRERPPATDSAPGDNSTPTSSITASSTPTNTGKLVQ